VRRNPDGGLCNTPYPVPFAPPRYFQGTAQFWSFPTDRLLAVLNADVPTTLATFQANSALAIVINSSLDALNLPQFPHRAPSEQGRADIKFDGKVFITSQHPSPRSKQKHNRSGIEALRLRFVPLLRLQSSCLRSLTGYLDGTRAGRKPTRKFRRSGRAILREAARQSEAV